ncbi:MAG: helix-turn-helix transcriptional regulator [Candidatus Pacebacteria bacterium]|nr:helix-turn-helix transcriptional regulator [Candidatus Paceibacterota bacterium]
MSISCLQLRVARAGLKISIERLSAETYVGISTIRRMESGPCFSKPKSNKSTLAAIVQYFEKHGVIFTQNNSVQFTVPCIEANNNTPDTALEDDDGDNSTCITA